MRKHRLFVAINLLDKIRKKLRDATAEWRDSPIRWTKKENLHITLVFIGYVHDEELSRIASVLPVAVRDIAPFEITLEKILPGPPGKTPRMVWVEGAVSPALAKLQSAVETVLFEDPESGYPSTALRASRRKETRPFRSHITLGRMEMRDWSRLHDKPRLEKPFHAIIPVSSIELMESELGPKGPTYTVLSSAALEG